MILTPQQLWKDYDRSKTPLAVKTVSASEDGVSSIRYVYFNGDSVLDGTPRIFAKLYIPASAPRTVSAVAVFDDPENSVDAFDPTEYLSRGFAVLVTDYAGEADGKTRYTLYPKSLSAHADLLKNTLSASKDVSAAQSCWYLYACVALRAMTFLENEGFTNRFVLGIGHGGEQVWKVCYFEGAARAGGVLFSGGVRKADAGVDANETDKNYLAYKAALDSSAYANFIKSPVFIQITSNEQNGSLPRMNKLYEAALERGAYFSVSERANRAIIPSRMNNIALWFSMLLEGNALPSPPKITAKGSENQLYLEIKVHDPAQIADAALFVAHKQKNSAYRNWRRHEMPAISEDEYLTRVAVFSVDSPVFAFVNITYKNGICISSAVERVNPALLNVAAEPSAFKRLLYDSSMGVSDWLVLSTESAADEKPHICSGPRELEGVTASHALTTFRLADPQYTGRADSVLQITLFSAAAQEIGFHIKNEKSVRFSCIKETVSMTNWVKFSFSPTDFKGSAGALTSWQDVLTFEVTFTSPVLVNSLLWV
ncbi:MAG: hypothetical protein FWH03_04550 [Firmicutes bacterium]|nr:hypothetical protein [Bacillota bacterium]